MPDVNLKSYKRVAIDDIRPHPTNARRGNAALLEESIEEHGVYRAIGIQKSTGYIIYGSHTWAAAKEKGRDQVIVEVHDVDDEEAQRMRLVDNRANDLAVYDDAMLAEALAELRESEEGLAGTGYSEATLDDLLDRLDASMPANVPDIDARLIAREASPMRQIILVMTADEFTVAIGHLTAIEQAHPELDNNTSAILWALDQVTE